MGIIGESWDCANRVRDILFNILDQQLKPRLLLRNGETGLNASVLSNIPSSSRSEDSDEARSSASPPQHYSSVPTAVHNGSHNGHGTTSRQRLETDMYPSWPPLTHYSSQHHPPMSIPPSSSLTPTSSNSTPTSGSTAPPPPPPSLSTHRIQPAQVQNPFIPTNPIFSSGAGLDVDMDVNMNFTGMSMDFSMDTLTNAPVPYAAFSMPHNLMDYHPVSTNGSGMPIRVGAPNLSRHPNGNHHTTPTASSSSSSTTTTSTSTSTTITGSSTNSSIPRANHVSGGNATGPGQQTSNAAGPGMGFSEADLAMMEHMVRQHQRSSMVPGPNHYRG